MATSPNIENYVIPTGKAFFTKLGDSDRRDLGNVVNFTVSGNITKKEHFRSYGGRRKKDRTDITQVGATGKFVLDEITQDNLSFFALGDPVEQTDGSFRIPGLTNTLFEGFLEIVPDNDRGPLTGWEGNVSFTPSGDFAMIQDNDNYNTINCEVDVQQNDDDEGFGTWIWNPGTAVDAP